MTRPCRRCALYCRQLHSPAFSGAKVRRKNDRNKESMRKLTDSYGIDLHFSAIDFLIDKIRYYRVWPHLVSGYNWLEIPGRESPSLK